MRRPMNRRLLAALGMSAMLIAGLLPSPIFAAPPRPDRAAPKALEGLRLDRPISREMTAPLSKLDSSLAKAKGPVSVIVRLATAPAGRVGVKGQAAQRAKIQKEQAGVE